MERNRALSIQLKFRKFRNEDNSYGNFHGEFFQKIRKMLNFVKQNHSNKSSRNRVRQVKWNGNSLKFWYTSQCFPLNRKFWNWFFFIVIGNFRKFKPKFFIAHIEKTQCDTRMKVFPPDRETLAFRKSWKWLSCFRLHSTYFASVCRRS